MIMVFEHAANDTKGFWLTNYKRGDKENKKHFVLFLGIQHEQYSPMTSVASTSTMLVQP